MSLRCACWEENILAFGSANDCVLDVESVQRIYIRTSLHAEMSGRIPYVPRPIFRSKINQSRHTNHGSSLLTQLDTASSILLWNVTTDNVPDCEHTHRL